VKTVFFIQLSDFIETALRVSISYSNRLKQVSFASYTDHKRISDPILAGDPAAASAAMQLLLQEALTLIEGSENSE
jgi:transcriptional regulator, GntR family